MPLMGAGNMGVWQEGQKGNVGTDDVEQRHGHARKAFPQALGG